MGSRVLVVTDNRKAEGDRLALAPAQDFLAMRGTTMPPHLRPEGIIDALQAATGTVVCADPPDNPGGVALGPLWDPMAVRLCCTAGEGGRLRFGGKIAPTSSPPIDAEVTVAARAARRIRPSSARRCRWPGSLDSGSSLTPPLKETLP